MPQVPCSKRKKEHQTKIHRSQGALDGIQRNFNHMIPHELQAPKMADIWPIENIWAIIKQDLDGQDFHNVKDQRAGIRAAWRRISIDKNLCKDLISSIPKRIKAIIKKKGN